MTPLHLHHSQTASHIHIRYIWSVWTISMLWCCGLVTKLLVCINGWLVIPTGTLFYQTRRPPAVMAHLSSIFCHCLLPCCSTAPHFSLFHPSLSLLIVVCFAIPVKGQPSSSWRWCALQPGPCHWQTWAHWLHCHRQLRAASPWRPQVACQLSHHHCNLWSVPWHLVHHRQ